MRFPIDYKVVGTTTDSMSFANLKPNEVEIPLGNHVGAFGVFRRFDRHKGVDLYCEEQTPVYAIEDGKVIDIRWFTGRQANCPWWNDTQAITIKGKSGNLIYGEIIADTGWVVDCYVAEGDILGHVTQVLKTDKGRPTTMLHFAMHNHGVMSCEQWLLDEQQPIGCIDPTNFLLRIEE